MSNKFQPFLLNDLNSNGWKTEKDVYRKRNSDIMLGASSHNDVQQKRQKICTKALDRPDPFSVDILREGLDCRKFGSVAKEIEDLIARRILKSSARACKFLDVEESSSKEVSDTNQQTVSDVIILDDDNDMNCFLGEQFLQPAEQAQWSGSVINLDSDDEDSTLRKSTDYGPLQDVKEHDCASKQHLGKIDERLAGEVELTKNKGPYVSVEEETGLEEGGEKEVYVGIEDDKETEESHEKGEVEPTKNKGPYVGMDDETGIEEGCEKEVYVGIENDTEIEESHEKGVYVGVEDDSWTEEEDDQPDANYDGAADIWKEMRVALECSKDVSDLSSDEHQIDGGEECDHSLILKDDIGYVCRVCGFIQRRIESIIEFQYMKGTRSTRTCRYEGWSCYAKPSEMLSDMIRSSSQDFTDNEIYAHPRHQKQMKPHQAEGFNFLLSNLMTDNPGGCIMAHAPGSGKTFMIISFLQSFMAKYPFARPLVVLPRGILATWKHEFKRWQVETIPLYDFYSVQAESRAQQLEVLQQWAGERSILFLGYKQFSSIVCDIDNSKISAACQEILLTCPSILILDEGHTPRNRDTDILTSLEKVQTPRKVVLSGTLYQNHVREVFNILNLVRPKFLKLDGSQAIKRRILSRLPLSSRTKSENKFYALVEQTLEKDDKDENFKRKVAVIQDLREMTSRVLHFYRGDFLDELPGLVDFNVHLRMSPNQEKEVMELKKLKSKFKINFEASAVYVHPQLKNLPKSSGVKDRVDEEKIDKILETIAVRDGVKAKFYLNLLQLCESNNEKLLVFSQYLLPLKFLERLTIKVKGYSVGKEIFMITGDSDSDVRESSMERFNTSEEARVFFGSIKACGEGISLVGASRILILDVHLNPSVTRQAIGRAFRPGQQRKVYTYRLVAHDSPEEEDHKTCFRKECIAKLWFEWNEYCGSKDFEMQLVDVKNCDDLFLESSRLNEDVHSLYRR